MRVVSPQRLWNRIISKSDKAITFYIVINIFTSKKNFQAHKLISVNTTEIICSDTANN